MKNYLLLFALAAVFTCTQVHAQTYDYAELTTVQMGVRERPAVQFDFANADSSKVYSDMMVKHIIVGIELLEKKGFELLNIVSTPSGNTTTTTAYMRRKK